MCAVFQLTGIVTGQLYLRHPGKFLSLINTKDPKLTHIKCQGCSYFRYLLISSVSHDLTNPNPTKTLRKTKAAVFKSFTKTACVRASDHQGALSLFTGGWCSRARSAGGWGRDGESGVGGWGWWVCVAPLSEAFDGPRRTTTRPTCVEKRKWIKATRKHKGSSGRRISRALMRFVEEVGAPLRECSTEWEWGWEGQEVWGAPVTLWRS